MSWFLLDRNLKLLEPYDWKLSRTVLRGERGSNAPDLPGKAIAREGTQELDDIVSSPIIKDTIVNNADCKILLDQRKYINKFDSVQSLLGLTDKEKGQILSINQANDPARKYKEV